MKHRAFRGLALALCLVLAGCTRAPVKLNGTVAESPTPAADFTLTDQNGVAFPMADAKGKVVVMTFLYTHCTDICPFVALKIKETIALLGADARKTLFLAVTTDPARDTVDAMASYSREAGLSDGWHLLTGDAAAVEKVWAAYGIGVSVESERKGAAGTQNGQSPARFVAPTQGLTAQDLDTAGRMIGAFGGGYEVSHTTPLIFIDPKGLLRAVMDPDAAPSQIAENVQALLPGATAAVAPAAAGARKIVVTYSVLGSVVKDLVGDAFDVVVDVPNGVDPHDWEPSAKDIETLNGASLVVENGLGLEGGMEKVLQRARSAGVRFFTATDHIQVRTVSAGEGVAAGDPDREVGARDPHFWTDPLSMRDVTAALAATLGADFSVDLSGRAADLEKRLGDLDAETRGVVQGLPAANRKLVTGHESLGYFARRYGLTLVGAVIPNLSTQAEASASQVASLVKLVKANGVRVVFTELGTPPAIAQALARDAGAKVVELRTHSLAPGGTYFSFIRDLAGTIAGSLR